MSLICRRFRVIGRVQGVFFRETTKRQADLFELKGHAFNCADGSVEVLACGSPDRVEQLAIWLWQGPTMARVDLVEELITDTEPPVGFRTGWQ